MLINHVLKRLSLFIWYVGPPEQTGHTSPFSKVSCVLLQGKKDILFPLPVQNVVSGQTKGSTQGGVRKFPAFPVLSHPPLHRACTWTEGGAEPWDNSDWQTPGCPQNCPLSCWLSLFSWISLMYHVLLPLGLVSSFLLGSALVFHVNSTQCVWHHKSNRSNKKNNSNSS